MYIFANFYTEFELNTHFGEDFAAVLLAVPVPMVKLAIMSPTVMAVLRRAAALKLAGTEVVFPGMGGNPMSDMTLLKVLRDAGEPFHVHGFRSTFTDWAADKTDYANAVVEAALAHKTPDATQAAYRKTTHLEKRRGLMEAWGSYCASEAGGKVIAFPAIGGVSK